MLFPFVPRLRHGLRSMRGDFLCLLLTLTFFGLFTSSAHAQSASVNGQVVDPSGALVRNVEITLTNQKTSTIQHTKTNNAGMYIVPFVTPGTYSLHAEAIGFSPYTQTNITVSTAQNLELDIRVQVGGTEQSVTVDGSGTQINTIDASVSTVIDRQFVENIPLNGRSLQSLLSIVPGVLIVPIYGSGNNGGTYGEITVNGQRTEANYFVVDGVSANIGAQPNQANIGRGGGYGGNLPNESALGTTQPLISLDALQEFRATTSSYSAEYGRSPGGQFSLSSRSGTDHLHGTVFDYFRNEALDANNFFNNYYGTPRLAERQNDFGGTLGGPLWFPGLKEARKTFFFTSYEGLRLTSAAATSITQVPSLAYRRTAAPAIQPFLNAYPLPNGADLTGRDLGLANFTSAYSVPSSLDAVSVRLDHTFRDNIPVFVRYSYSPSNVSSRGSVGLAELDSSGTGLHSITGGLTNTFGPHASNQLRFNYSWTHGFSDSRFDNFGGATPLTNDYLASVPGLGSNNWFQFGSFGNKINGYSHQPNDIHQHQLNIVDTFSRAIGRHELKAGIDYRRIDNEQSIPSLFFEVYYLPDEFASNTPFINLAFRSDRSSIKPVYTNFSAFVQDEWKVTNRLNLSLGLRWELNPPPTDADGHNPYAVTNGNPVTAQLAPQGTPLWRTMYDAFAPRVGLAYQLHQQSHYATVLRVGGGLFFDTGTAQGPQGYWLAAGTSSETNLGGSAFPYIQAQIDNLPAPSAAAPYNADVTASDPNLRLPRTWQWNMALQQEFGSNANLTVSYVGSAGRKLLMEKQYNVSSLNSAFASGTYLYLTTNSASSDYDALQVQYQRALSHGFQGLLTYTWAHSMDDVTSNFWVLEQQRSVSDNDIRNNFQAAATYEIPVRMNNKTASYLLSGWAAETRVSARSALPVDVLGEYMIDPTNGANLNLHPNRRPGIPLYVSSPNAPGGRVINCLAFVEDCSNPDASLPLTEGNFGRNGARGFRSVQADVSLRKDFPIGDRAGLQFRIEAFNVFNHPIFGAIYNSIDSSPTDASGSSLFGQAYQTGNASLGGLSSLYQMGGPRSLQAALKLHF